MFTLFKAALKQGDAQWELNKYLSEETDRLRAQNVALSNRISNLERAIDGLTTRQVTGDYDMMMPRQWNVRTLAEMLHQVLEILGYEARPPDTSGWRINKKPKLHKK